MRILGLILPWLCLSSPLLAQMQITNIASTPAGCSSNGTVTVTVSGGTPIYCYQINGGPCLYSASDNYVFTDLTPGLKTVTVTDGLNTATISASVEVMGNYQNPNLFGLPQGCGVYAQASGGLPPYQYAISTGGGPFSTLQNDPQFTPVIGNYCLRVYDACNNFTEYCGVIDISAVDFTATCCETTANPTEICVQFTDRTGLHANDPGYWFGGQPPYLYTATAAGLTITSNDGNFNLQQLCPGWTFSITDACGNTATRTPNCMKTTVLCVDCNAGTANIVTENGVAPYVYYYQDAAGQWQPNPAGGTSGNFSGLPISGQGDSYIFRSIDACGTISPTLEVQCLDALGYYDCLAQTVRIEPQTSFFPAYISCTTCPGLPVVTLSQQGLAAFPTATLGPNTFHITDACGASTSIHCRDTLPDLSIQKSCNSIFVRMRSNYICDSEAVNPYSIESGVLYELALAAVPGTVIASNTTGIFTNLTPGASYIVTATHVNCGVATATVTLYNSSDFTLNTELKITSFIQNGICQTGYQVLADIVPAPELSPVFELVGSSAFLDTIGFFTDIAPGTWTVSSSNYCLSETLVLPDWKPEMSVQMPECPNGGCVQVSGARTTAEWAAWGAGYGLNIITNSDFYILGCPGFNGPNCVANWGGNICNLIPNNSYEVYLKPGTFTCPVDTISFVVDPTGTAKIDSVHITTPVACTDTSLANVLVTVFGGKTPVYLEVIDTTTGLVLRTFYDWDNDHKIAIDSLKALQKYLFRVIDDCNNTKDISTTVVLLPNVTASYTRNCDTTYTLETASIFNAVYTWKDATGSVLATGANQWSIRTQALPAASNYSVEINFGNCLAHITDVNTPAYVPAAVNLPFSDTLFCDIFSLLLTADTGPGNYAFAWNTSDTTQGIFVNSEGNYTVIGTDIYGCSDSATATIVASPPFLININTTDTDCHGGTNGTATISVLGGGTPNFTYAWANGANTPNRSDLTAGVFTVTVTDAKTCSQTAQLTIGEPLPLFIALNGTDISCHGYTDGQITVNASGGTAPYGYVWNNSNTTQALGNLQHGWYTVTCTDANGCTVSNTLEIQQPDSIVLNYVFTPILCFGENTGAIAAYSSGGTGNMAYQWSVSGGTNNILQNLTAGIYALTATDQNNCTAVDTVALTQPDLLSVAIIGNNITCFGANNGSLVATATGGSMPLKWTAWSTGAVGNAIAALSAGTYTVTITDTNNCTATATHTLVEPPPLSVTIATTPTACYTTTDGTATAIPIGGAPPYQFEWSINAQDTSMLQGLPTGIYTVTITDSLLCTATAMGAITSPPPLSINHNASMVSCYGGTNGSIDAWAAGGTPSYTYLWNNNATTPLIQNLSAGVYTLTLTDQNSCTTAQSVTITAPPPLVVNGVNTVKAGCNGDEGAANISITGGTAPFSAIWNNGQTGLSIQGLSAGNYAATITDGRGCTVVANAVVDGILPLEIEVSTVSVSCFGQADGAVFFETLAGGAGPPYFIDGVLMTGNAIQYLPAGTHSWLVSDGQNCSETVSVTLSEPPLFSISLPSIIRIELGDAVALQPVINGNPAPPLNWVWTPALYLSCDSCASTIATPYQSTQYELIAEDAFGCTATDLVQILVNRNCKVYVPNIFTPNNSGDLNTRFMIYSAPCIKRIISWQIYDRWGDQVFAQKDFQPNDLDYSWDGTVRNKSAIEGVYTWYARYELIDGTEEFISGDVTIWY